VIGNEAGLKDRIDIVPAFVVRRSCAAEYKTACFLHDLRQRGVFELHCRHRPILSYFSCKVFKLNYTHKI
jgi:hypothetical protein